MKEEELMYENYYEKNFGFESRLILQKFSDDHISGNDYITIEGSVTRDNARKICQRGGGDLASLTSKKFICQYPIIDSFDNLNVKKDRGIDKNLQFYI